MLTSFMRHVPIALAAAASAAPAQEADFFRADEDAPPIYLYQDAQGTAYTIELSDGTGPHRAVQLKPVSSSELKKIEFHGFRIKYIKDIEDGISTPSRNAPGTNSTIISYVTSLPQSFSIFQSGTDAYGNFAVVSSQQPPLLTQWVVFTYKSANVANFGTHAPIVMLVDTQQLAGGFPPTYAPALVGNGILIGNVSTTPGGVWSREFRASL